MNTEMKPIEILSGMEGQSTYCTTRGTMGDADGIAKVDTDLMEDFSDAKVYTLPEIKEVNEKAYEDIKDWTAQECPNVEESEFYVLQKDTQYLTAWV